jgi:hypothetical protein
MKHVEAVIKLFDLDYNVRRITVTCVASLFGAATRAIRGSGAARCSGMT